METALAIGHLGLGAHKMGEKKNLLLPKKHNFVYQRNIQTTNK